MANVWQLVHFPTKCHCNPLQVSGRAISQFPHSVSTLRHFLPKISIKTRTNSTETRMDGHLGRGKSSSSHPFCQEPWTSGHGNKVQGQCTPVDENMGLPLSLHFHFPAFTEVQKTWDVFYHVTPWLDLLLLVKWEHGTMTKYPNFIKIWGILRSI